MVEIDWFDQLQINYDQAPEGFIGIHAYKKGIGCAYFEVPLEWENEPNFLDMIYEESKIQWKKLKGRADKRPSHCPVCKNRYIGSFDYRYHGVKFCRWCGSWYKQKAGQIIVLRRTDETQ